MPARDFVLAATAALVRCCRGFPELRARLPRMPVRRACRRAAAGQALLDPSDTVLLLLDHRSGLLPDSEGHRRTVLSSRTDTGDCLRSFAVVHGVPVITSASEPNGPDGPLMPEEWRRWRRMRSACPARREVDAWDSEDFVDAVRQTGRKTLIIAGVWTSVCVMFPALDAKAAGYKVYAVMDASGDPSELASRTTLARFAQAGVIPTTANAVLSEVHRTWNRPDAAEVAKLYGMVAPNYAAVAESFQRAQEAAAQKK